MTLTKEEIGARLRARRKQRKLTLIELMERSGINNGSLSKIERGAQSVTSESLIRLCKAYGIDLDQLLAPISDQKEGDDEEPQAINFDQMLHDTVGTTSIVWMLERYLETLPSEVENKVRRRLCRREAPKKVISIGGEFFIYQLKHTPIHPASHNE